MGKLSDEEWVKVRAEELARQRDLGALGRRGTPEAVAAIVAEVVQEGRSLRGQSVNPRRNSFRAGARAYRHSRRAICESCGSKGTYTVRAKPGGRLRHLKCSACGKQALRWARYRRGTGR